MYRSKSPRRTKTLFAKLRRNALAWYVVLAVLLAFLLYIALSFGFLWSRPASSATLSDGQHLVSTSSSDLSTSLIPLSSHLYRFTLANPSTKLSSPVEFKPGFALSYTVKNSEGQVVLSRDVPQFQGQTEEHPVLLPSHSLSTLINLNNFFNLLADGSYTLVASVPLADGVTLSSSLTFAKVSSVSQSAPMVVTATFVGLGGKNYFEANTSGVLDVFYFTSGLNFPLASLKEGAKLLIEYAYSGDHRLVINLQRLGS